MLVLLNFGSWPFLSAGSFALRESMGRSGVYVYAKKNQKQKDNYYFYYYEEGLKRAVDFIWRLEI